MKILITGGHLTPALAFISYVQKNHSQDQIVFVGRVYTQDKLKQKAREESELKKRKIKFFQLEATKFSLTTELNLIKSVTSPATFIKSVRSSTQILKTTKPDVVLSFGGYLAVPVTLAARLLNIPIVTHEQTRAAGFANQFISSFATTIAISYPSSKKYFPRKKSVVTGNPTRRGLGKGKLKLGKRQRPSWIKGKLAQPILLIMGGSQGSLFINNLVGETISELLDDWVVIHQCGRPNQKHNYLRELELVKLSLPEEKRKKYFIREWLEEQELSWSYAHAAAAVTRAGANTTLELTLNRVPTVFIPLPFSHRNEQQLNATYLMEKGAAILLTQKSATPQSLLQALNSIHQQRALMKKELASISVPTNADELLYEVVVRAVK